MKKNKVKQNNNHKGNNKDREPGRECHWRESELTIATKEISSNSNIGLQTWTLSKQADLHRVGGANFQREGLRGEKSGHRGPVTNQTTLPACISLSWVEKKKNRS